MGLGERTLMSNNKGVVQVNFWQILWGPLLNFHFNLAIFIGILCKSLVIYYGIVSVGQIQHFCHVEID